MAESPATPDAIRHQSKQIVLDRLGYSTPLTWEQKLRVALVQSGGDPALADLLSVSRQAHASAKTWVEKKFPVVTDVTMVEAGIQSYLPVNTYCYVHDPDVATEAKKQQTTRSAIGIRTAINNLDQFVLAIGNAPTALLEFLDRDPGPDRVPLVIGGPVGFVSVKQSKKLLLESDYPNLVIEKTRGGSGLTATLLNTSWSHVSGDER